jgi:hypothetical protein
MLGGRQARGAIPDVAGSADRPVRLSKVGAMPRNLFEIIELYEFMR